MSTFRFAERFYMMEFPSDFATPTAAVAARVGRC